MRSRPVWPEITVALRTGDTSQKERQAFVRKPRHILITTPESLYLMLTAARARETLRKVQTVIVDEIHALARDKRGSHLSLSLARLDHVAEQRPARIGLSATQRPVEEIAAFLVGTERSGYTPPAHPAPAYQQHPADIEVIELPEVLREETPPPNPLPAGGEGGPVGAGGQRNPLAPMDGPLGGYVITRERGERWQTPPDLWEKLRPLARESRHEPTDAEDALWQRLRRNQLDGLAFRRQHVIDRFIVDFYCPSKKLVVEVDGSIHESRHEEDALREQILQSMGLRIVRFSNEEVLNQIDQVIKEIRSATKGEASPPSPPAGRGLGGGVTLDA